jgi:hypothetical protein
MHIAVKNLREHAGCNCGGLIPRLSEGDEPLCANSFKCFLREGGIQQHVRKKVQCLREFIRRGLECKRAILTPDVDVDRSTEQLLCVRQRLPIACLCPFTHHRRRQACQSPARR